VARPRATSRDPEEWARATEKARDVRAAAAREVAGTIAEQVEALIVDGDVMGGRAMFAARLAVVAAAERRGDPRVLRAAVIDAAAALGAWAAALDYVPPSELNGAA
jgi:hypothetical protein